MIEIPDDIQYANHLCILAEYQEQVRYSLGGGAPKEDQLLGTSTCGIGDLSDTETASL